MHRPERKHFDHDVAYTTQTATAVITALTTLAQGTDEAQFVGNRIFTKSIYVTGQCAPTAGVASMLRLMIVQDSMNTGTAPTQAMILDSSASNPIWAPLQRDTLGRFKVLFDRRIPLNPTTATTTCVKNIKLYKRWNSIIQYTATSAGYKNMIYAYSVSDNTANPPSLGYTARTTYTDS